jgi:hypothetical protein
MISYAKQREEKQTSSSSLPKIRASVCSRTGNGIRSYFLLTFSQLLCTNKNKKLTSLSCTMAAATEDSEAEGLFNDLSKLCLEETQPLILCDLGYGLPKEARPRKEKILAMSRQIVNFLEWQMAASDKPAQVKIVGSNDEAGQEAIQQRMEQLWKDATNSTSLPAHVTFSDESLESFQGLVYLSPDATEVLDPCVDPPRIVVVGMLIDRRIQVNRSLQRASHIGVEVARWPLERLGTVGCNEPLNVDCILEGMQQWYWNCENPKVSRGICFENAANQALQHHQERHPQRPQHKI